MAVSVVRIILAVFVGLSALLLMLTICLVVIVIVMALLAVMCGPIRPKNDVSEDT